MANQVVWFDIPTIDLTRAVAFYSAVLNCEMEIEEFPAGKIAVLPHANEDVSGCLYESDAHRPSRDGILLYFKCDDRLCDAVQAAVDNGGEVLQPKHQIGPHGYRAVVLDSEGNQIALHSQTDS